MKCNPTAHVSCKARNLVFAFFGAAVCELSLSASTFELRERRTSPSEGGEKTRDSSMFRWDWARSSDSDLVLCLELIDQLVE